MMNVDNKFVRMCAGASAGAGAGVYIYVYNKKLQQFIAWMQTARKR